MIAGPAALQMLPEFASDHCLAHGETDKLCCSLTNRSLGQPWRFEVLLCHSMLGAFQI